MYLSNCFKSLFNFLKNKCLVILTVSNFFFVLLLRDKVLPVELILLNRDVGANGGIGGDRVDL